MLSVSALLTAAKGAHAITSNYRLARVLDTTDNTLYRWTSGRGVPDDEHAVKLADLAGMDRGYVIAAMRALREPNEALRSEWVQMAERLKAQSGGAPVPPPPTPSDDESGPDSGASGPGGGSLIGNIGRALGASPDDAALCVMSTESRMSRIVRASLGKAIKKARAH